MKPCTNCGRVRVTTLTPVSVEGVVVWIPICWPCVRAR